MSASLLSRLPFRTPIPGRPSFRTRLNGSGAAGPRRILAIGLGAAAIGGTLLAATFIQRTPPIESHPGRLPAVNALPGGVNSNPHQNALALRSNQEAANRAEEARQSFTPQISAGQSYAQKPLNPPLLTSPPPAAEQKAAPATMSVRITAQPLQVTPAVVRVDAAAPAQTSQGQATRVQAIQGQARTETPEDVRYRIAIERMMNGWGNRAPRTDVIIPPDAQDVSEASRNGPGRPERAAGDGSAALVSPVVARSGGERHRVLIPAGRGVYAHTILAASSDAQSPVVLQADSGPIAGARMIGNFVREDERLVIRVNRVIHQGQEIGVEGIVVAPATMEAGVASSVDQHYLARFALPAAAAFVQGLGQAFALSNSTVVASPFGGATALQRLNLGQQVGIGAGAAAGRVGQALDQAAPRGPTVKLDVGSSVGVMFLTNVALPG